MFLRIIIFSVFLFFFTSGFAAANTVPVPKEKDARSQYADDNIIIYKWIDGVRWAFVYSFDGVFVNCYPDPDY